jgi:hypothetical protein
MQRGGSGAPRGGSEAAWRCRSCGRNWQASVLEGRREEGSGLEYHRGMKGEEGCRR